MTARRVVAAPDKFRGTATAAEISAAVDSAATAQGWECDQVPVADGGEGTLAVLGGANRHTMVTGPAGDPVEAGWRLDGRIAIIEMAQASGLILAGGAEHNDPIAADSFGTGELIQLAVESGATRIIVGMGGSATVDGGLGALRAMHPHQRYRAVDIDVACDVRTPFLRAAEVFGPQKGASKAQIRLLTNRLARLADVYEQDYGVDVRAMPGAGAAGGLAGGLAAIGAELLDGFTLVAEQLRLDEVLVGADVVVTGEGFLDGESFDGKVVGGVAELARALGVPVVAVVGQVLDGVDPALTDGIEVVSLAERFGLDDALENPAERTEWVIQEILARHTS